MLRLKIFIAGVICVSVILVINYFAILFIYNEFKHYVGYFNNKFALLNTRTNLLQDRLENIGVRLNNLSSLSENDKETVRADISALKDEMERWQKDWQAKYVSVLNEAAQRLNELGVNPSAKTAPKETNINLGEISVEK